MKRRTQVKENSSQHTFVNLSPGFVSGFCLSSFYKLKYFILVNFLQPSSVTWWEDQFIIKQRMQLGRHKLKHMSATLSEPMRKPHICMPYAGLMEFLYLFFWLRFLSFCRVQRKQNSSWMTNSFIPIILNRIMIPRKSLLVNKIHDKK